MAENGTIEERQVIPEGERLLGAVEAILFAMGDSVSLHRLARAIGQDEERTLGLVEELSRRYEAADRGLRILNLEGSFQLCTKKEFYKELIQIAVEPKKPVLTEVLLETLSIIAYRQPVTKVEIEKIRGVKSDHAVNKLVEWGLVKELGRLDAPGRPLLFGTTEEFLRSFGVEAVEDLPVVDPVKMEDFKAEAESEAAKVEQP